MLLQTLCIISIAVQVISTEECIYIKNNDFSQCPNLHKMLTELVGLHTSIPMCNKKTGDNNTGKATASTVITTRDPGTIQPLLKDPPGRLTSCPLPDVCNKTFRLAIIDLFPFVSITKNSIMIMLRHCCQTCVKPCLVKSIKDISQLNESLLAETDIVFPVFGRTLNTKLYGFYYIPMIDIPYSYYIRKANTHEDVINTMMSDFSKLWPLLIICLVFAITAGFIIWLLDTWVNEDEFPRRFLLGWFEGFWWSFISMTTVGYGDKAPKSRIARVFSVAWILVGITIFSLLTASLSNLIMSAETPPSFDMTGKKVAALQYRIHDATIIAKHGGRLHPIAHDNLTDGVNQMIDLLFSGNQTIDGFVIEKHIYLKYCEDKERCKRLKKTVRGEKYLSQEKFSYGMLIRERADYDYFRAYIEYNWFHFDTCMDLANNEMSRNLPDRDKVVIFAVGSGVFKPIAIGVLVFIGVCLIGGIIFEFTTKVKKAKTNDIRMT